MKKQNEIKETKKTKKLDKVYSIYLPFGMLIGTLIGLGLSIWKKDLLFCMYGLLIGSFLGILVGSIVTYIKKKKAK